MEETVIQRCLDGIFNMDYPKDKMQVIVVDGKSGDNTCKILGEFSEKYPQNIKIISGENRQRKACSPQLALPTLTGT